MKLKQGFTLVEVVVVIGIIAILTVIIFPSISNIRAKNRDTERVSDIAALQLGLSLFYNQTGSYPTSTLDTLVPKYFPADSLVPPTSRDDDKYVYIPLARGSDLTKCTYYHLGAVLELPSGQVDSADTFSTEPGNISNGYKYCESGGSPIYTEPTGLVPGPQNYNVHP